jgi:hypothetical protein
MPIRGDRLRWPPRPGKRSGGARATLATDEQKPAPQQPNERDESADPAPAAPRPVIKQAHDDLQQGQTDTDNRTRAAQTVGRKDEPQRRKP